MSEYKHMKTDDLVRHVKDHIGGITKGDPFNVTVKGHEIPYEDWPVKIKHIVYREVVDFDSTELCYRIPRTSKHSWDNDIEVSQPNYTGSVILEIEQEMTIEGKIGLEVDDSGRLIFDPNSTNINFENEIWCTGGQSEAGESPPF